MVSEKDSKGPIDDGANMTQRVTTRMLHCAEALGADALEHQVAPEGSRGFDHRLVVNGHEGPWVSKYEIAHNGLYCASHPYRADELPRVFFAIEIHPHKIRQPEVRDPRSPLSVVSNPDPGVETGIETPPPSAIEPPLSAADGGEVPRLDARSMCVDCGTTTLAHRRDCRTLWALIGACVECGVPKGAHNRGCSKRAAMCMGCMGHGRVGHKAGVGGVDTRRDCRACGGTGSVR